MTVLNSLPKNVLDKLPLTAKVIAVNQCDYQYEYDHYFRYAFVCVQSDGNLLFRIVFRHVKSGLGAGDIASVRVSENIGSLINNNLKRVAELMKSYNFEKSHYASRFSRQWTGILGGEDKLSDIIKWYKKNADFQRA